MNEIFEFESQSDFEKFEFDLLKKVSAGKVEIFDIDDEDELNVFNFEERYRCSSCGKNWIMSAPKDTWKGYFLIQKNAIKYQKKLNLIDKGKLAGCCFISAVFLIILVWYFVF